MSASLMARMLSKRTRSDAKTQVTTEPKAGEDDSAVQPQAFSVNASLSTSASIAAGGEEYCFPALAGSPSQRRRQDVNDAQKLLEGLSFPPTFSQEEELGLEASMPSACSASSVDSCEGLALSDAPELTHGWSVLDEAEEAMALAITMDDSNLSVTSRYSSTEGLAIFENSAMYTTKFDGAHAIEDGGDITGNSLVANAPSFDAALLTKRVAHDIAKSSVTMAIRECCHAIIDRAFDPPRAPAYPPTMAATSGSKKAVETPAKQPAALALLQKTHRQSMRAPETPETVREARSALGLRTDLPKPRRRVGKATGPVSAQPSVVHRPVAIAATKPSTTTAPAQKPMSKSTSAFPPQSRRQLGHTLPPPKIRRKSGEQNIELAKRAPSQVQSISPKPTTTKTKSPKTYVVGPTVTCNILDVKFARLSLHPVLPFLVLINTEPRCSATSRTKSLERQTQAGKHLVECDWHKYGMSVFSFHRHF